MKKSKKILSGIMAMCLMGAVAVVPENVAPAVSMTASAETPEYTYGRYELLTYHNYGDYIEIFGCDESATEVVIPSEIDGVPVTSIGYMAFCSCKNLISIDIPESVTNIGSSSTGNAFSGTPWLEEKRKENPLVIVNNILIEGATCEGDVIIPDGVTSIIDCSFVGDRSLESIYIPDSVTSIGEMAFAYCNSLTSIEIPESVTSIGKSAFLDTLWLKEKRKENPLVIVNNILIDGITCTDSDIVIPDSVTSIGDSSFSSNRNLTSINIPYNVTKIGRDVFRSCQSLKEVTILNPECDIYDSQYTISNGFEYPKCYFNGTIYGYANSTAQVYAEKYGYNFVALEDAPNTSTPLPESTVTGDANGDNEINISDTVLIMQSISNPNEYKLSESAKSFADVVDKGDGLTGMDALAIQMVEAKIITTDDLPITSEELNSLIK